MLWGALWLPGCASMSIEEAVPAGALASNAQGDGANAAPADASAAAPASGGTVAGEPASGGGLVGTGPSAPSNSGEYPNLNIARRAAADQLSQRETAAESSALKRAAVQQGQDAAATATTASASELERLRKLRVTHGAEALKEIEGE